MAQTFTLFPLLPTELRLQIWQHTFPTPRRIRINRWTPGPSALYVNHEARGFVKQFYDLIPRPVARKIFSCYGWMNFDLDIIDGSGIRELHYIPEYEETCKKIKRIHMDVGTWMGLFTFPIFTDKLDSYKADFPNLEKVDVIVHEHASNGSETVDEVITKLERNMVPRVKEIEEKWSLEGKQWHSPTFAIDLCPSTRHLIATQGRTECTDIYCEARY